MKHKLYKNVIMLFAIGFIANTFAQKFDEKYVENFKVNKDVEVVINASNTEINVTNWDKNEVQIEAFIEVEGLSKEEAEKYFKNWNFEALGNKAKVKITSLGNHSTHLRNDFIIHENIDFEMPDIQLPDFDSIVIPNINFDFDFDFDFDYDFDFNFDEIEKNMYEDDDFSFEWNHDGENISIKSQEEWEAFKKTKKYKELKEKMSFDKEKMQKQLELSKIKMKEGLERAKIQIKKIDKEQIKKQLEKAKIEFQKIDKEEIKRSLAEARKQIMEMRIDFNSKSDDVIINGKKINIKKRLEIKVPKNAIFNLNTRYSKVKLPKTVASGNVKYGSFNVDNLIGGRLNIDFSKVTINDLNGCTLFLNNVIDAKIASITNSELVNNSSGLKVTNINENVKVINKFGELKIMNIIPNYQTFTLNLNNAEAELNLSAANSNLKLKADNIIVSDKAEKNKKILIFNGSINTYDNSTFNIKGENSKLTVKREIL